MYETNVKGYVYTIGGGPGHKMHIRPQGRETIMTQRLFLVDGGAAVALSRVLDEARQAPRALGTRRFLRFAARAPLLLPAGQQS